MQQNEELKAKARAEGSKVELKRQPVGPRPAHFVSSKKTKPEIVEPIPYEFIA